MKSIYQINEILMYFVLGGKNLPSQNPKRFYRQLLPFQKIGSIFALNPKKILEGPVKNCESKH